MRISPVALAVTLTGVAGVQVVSSAAAGRIGGVQVPRSLARSPAPAEAFDEAHHPDPDLPTFRIDAIVTDARGRSVDGLTAEDFQVIENGSPQPIENLRFVKADGQASS